MKATTLTLDKIDIGFYAVLLNGRQVGIIKKTDNTQWLGRVNNTDAILDNCTSKYEAMTRTYAIFHDEIEGKMRNA
jgi:hypothetical protein